MKILRFDSVGGASGDMILGVLIGLGIEPRQLNTALSGLLRGEHFKIIAAPFSDYGIHGTQASVEIDSSHSHAHRHGRNLKDITDIISPSQLPAAVKAMSMKVFNALAKAESNVHGISVEKIHFHEVGAVDSIVDIAGACLGLSLLNIDGISVSPLPSGQGTFTCQHGTYPLPPPAVVELLRNTPMVMTDEPYELVTPTGAALLSTWTNQIIPAGSRIVAAANSFGKRKLNSRPNLLRGVIYETSHSETSDSDQVIILETNLDDCPAELIGVLFDKLFAAGALDVWTTPIMMKKQRPGIMLSALCHETGKNALYDIIFAETTTFGIRESLWTRQCLPRRFDTVTTCYGDIKVKVGTRNGTEITASPEIADCIRQAHHANVPVKQVYYAAIAAWQNNNTRQQGSH
jgi:uncharacterized protein (TIGR00299 family) protein